MNNDMSLELQLGRPGDPTSPPEMDITETVLNSPVLLRLVEEVRVEQVAGHQSYNRMHNRHNRSR